MKIASAEEASLSPIATFCTPKLTQKAEKRKIKVDRQGS